MHDKERLDKDVATLKARADNLERSIAELPDDASEADGQFFADELRLTKAKIASAENRLSELAATEEAEALKAAEEEQSDLLKLYRAAEAEGRLGTMEPALRQRCLRAVEAAGNAKLFGVG